MKRIADWLEKISAGAMLIGLFQNNLWAVAIGIGALVGSVYMTRRMQWPLHGSQLSSCALERSFTDSTSARAINPN